MVVASAFSVTAPAPAAELRSNVNTRVTRPLAIRAGWLAQSFHWQLPLLVVLTARAGDLPLPGGSSLHGLKLRVHGALEWAG